jgi:hypothetical protein
VRYLSPREGGLLDAFGKPLGPGETVAGAWAQVEGLEMIDIFKPATALFIQSSEYDALGDTLNFETDGSLSTYRGRRIFRG